MPDKKPRRRAALQGYACGVPEIARAIGWEERQTRYALEQGHLTAGRIGSVWIADPEKLRAEIAAIAAGTMVR
jgi:hypothetical protein